MILPIPRKKNLHYCAAALALALLQACSPHYSYKENAVPESVKLSQRLQAMFTKTKMICFGRYALEVPQEAQLVWGGISIPDDVKIIIGNLESSKLQVAADIEKLKKKNSTTEITYNNKGPIEESWQIRYYKGKIEKEYGLHFFNTYISKGDLTFIIGDSVDDEGTEELTASPPVSD
jgi:hypothetical protein